MVVLVYCLPIKYNSGLNFVVNKNLSSIGKFNFGSFDAGEVSLYDNLLLTPKTKFTGVCVSVCPRGGVLPVTITHDVLYLCVEDPLRK